MEETPLLISVPQAARRLGCGTSFVYGLCSRGELPKVALGRASRIPVAALAAYVERQTRLAQARQQALATMRRRDQRSR